MIYWPARRGPMRYLVAEAMTLSMVALEMTGSMAALAGIASFTLAPLATVLTGFRIMMRLKGKCWSLGIHQRLPISFR